MDAGKKFQSVCLFSQHLLLNLLLGLLVFHLCIYILFENHNTRNVFAEFNILKIDGLWKNLFASKNGYCFELWVNYNFFFYYMFIIHK